MFIHSLTVGKIQDELFYRVYMRQHSAVSDTTKQGYLSIMLSVRQRKHPYLTSLCCMLYTHYKYSHRLCVFVASFKSRKSKKYGDSRMLKHIRTKSEPRKNGGVDDGKNGI
jgi:hypothetical protein